MYNIIRMLKAMGFTVEAEEKPDTEYGTVNSGYLVVKKDDVFYKVDYTVDSYGGDLEIQSTRKVTPKPVEKVEYV